MYLKSLTRSFANMAAGPSELHQTVDVMYVDMRECKMTAASFLPFSSITFSAKTLLLNLHCGLLKSSKRLKIEKKFCSKIV